MKNTAELLRLKKSMIDDAHQRNMDDHALRIRCLDEAGETFADGTALDKSMEFLRLYNRAFEPYVRPELYFAGVAGYFYIPRPRVGILEDVGHYCADYKRLIDLGVRGIYEKILGTDAIDMVGTVNKAAFLETLDLFVGYMQKHADEAERQAKSCADGVGRENLCRIASDIRYICENPPKTFLQGLQLIWFAHTYILLKPYTNTITFGNLDRILAELYEREKAQGALDEEKATEIVCQFFLSVMPMQRDTQNIVVGGSDEAGNYFENDLTRIFLRAQSVMRTEQPSVSLKIRPDTSDAVWAEALQLLAGGGGMPSFLNDRVYADGLKKLGFAEADANTFCNVGCYEATAHGNTFGGTVSGNVGLAYEFANFFRQPTAYGTFQEFLEGWEAYLTERYTKEIVVRFAHERAMLVTCAASPFTACLMDGCVESLRLPEQYGAKYNIFTVLLGGIGTLTDSLICVKRFVYEEKAFTLDELRRQVAENFPDGEVLAKIRAFSGRFGSGNAAAAELARREAAFLYDLITGNPINAKTKMMPALFIFTGWVYTDDLPATPDGRRAGERYSYGVSASELVVPRNITSVLTDSASLPLTCFPLGAPQTVNLMADLFTTAKGREVVRRMVETYFTSGGSHIQIEAANAEVLEEAQKNPDAYRDLLIRISGHTEPFVRLDKALQDALIARSKAR